MHDTTVMGCCCGGATQNDRRDSILPQNEGNNMKIKMKYTPYRGEPVLSTVLFDNNEAEFFSFLDKKFGGYRAGVETGKAGDLMNDYLAGVTAYSKDEVSEMEHLEYVRYASMKETAEELAKIDPETIVMVTERTSEARFDIHMLPFIEVYSYEFEEVE